MAPEAFYGLAGEIVAAIEPHSEADPAALLLTLLAGFGALVGPGPHALADAAEHPARIWPQIVGDTAKARKGSSWSQVRRVLSAADQAFVTDRVLAGFGSGEALVDAVSGDQDRRLLVVESEYARILAVCKREGSTLPALQRQAWDGGRLQVRSRAGTAVADGAHIVIVGHITRAELLARMAESDTLGGSLNRFLIVAARRSKLLPSGGALDDAIVADFGRKIASVATQARRIGILRRTEGAEQYWAGLYERLADDEPGGVLGAVIARDSAQILRLSVTFALLDGRHQIDVEHIVAAEATWNYCRASASIIFGERTGDDVADRLLTELIKVGTAGLDGKQTQDLLGRHVKRERLEPARQLLIDRGLAVEVTQPTKGRPRRLLVAATKATKATEVPSDDLLSDTSHMSQSESDSRYEDAPAPSDEDCWWEAEAELDEAIQRDAELEVLMS